MLEKNYRSLTQEELNRYGYYNISFRYTYELDDYEEGVYHHNYGESAIEDIVYDTSQDDFLINQFLAYDKYAPQLTVDDGPKRMYNGLLKVKCKFCGKHFVPEKIDVRQRITYLNNFKYGQRHFYCSDECKESCPLIITYKRDTSFSQQAKEIALELSDRKCEICGVEENLEAHHIIPFKISPLEAYDSDNIIILCRNCHMERGHSDRECTTGYLANCS